MSGTRKVPPVSTAEAIEGQAKTDPMFAIAWAILKATEAQSRLAGVIHDATTELAGGLHEIAAQIAPENPHNEKVADALQAIGTHLKYLGNGNAASQMGAIEALSVQIREGLDGMADAIRSRDE